MRRRRPLLIALAAMLVATVSGGITTASAGTRSGADVFEFGDAGFYGSTGSISLNAPLISLAPTPTGSGYWLLSGDGGVFSYGDAAFRGSTGGRRLNQPVVAMAADPQGRGYWLVASDGGIFSFGVPFLGSMGARALNQPIVGMAATTTGDGYWLVASDGGIFSFGDARFAGSTGARRLNQPIVGMAADPDGSGYWLVASDGGVFAFGAPFLGSAANQLSPGDRIVGMAASAGGGYRLASQRGGVFTFGGATFAGAGTDAGRPIVAMASTPSGGGYWLAVGRTSPPPGGGGTGAGPANMSADPSDTTPDVLDGDVVKFAQLGDTMYAGGAFTSVRDKGTTVPMARSNLVAFRASTGRVLPLNLAVNGKVWGIVPEGNYLYLTGEFTTVNGVAARYTAKWDLLNNRLDPAFNAVAVSAPATDSEMVNGRLVVSGAFPRGIIALNPVTGADTGFITAAVTGTVSTMAGATRVFRFATDPAGTRLVLLGNFTAVGGVPRRQVAQLNLGSAATVSSWYDMTWDQDCSPAIPVYGRDVEFSPDGRSFVIVTTGGQHLREKLCDTAVKYDTSNVSGDAVPAWVNFTPQDTLLSVAITGNSVYVGGHQKAVDVKVFQNGLLVKEAAIDGGVIRQGIAALDYTTGYAQAWDPTRTRGVGAAELVALPAGLWVGSDTEEFGHELHARIAMTPRIAP